MKKIKNNPAKHIKRENRLPGNEHTYSDKLKMMGRTKKVKFEEEIIDKLGYSCPKYHIKSFAKDSRN